MFVMMHGWQLIILHVIVMHKHHMLASEGVIASAGSGVTV